MALCSLLLAGCAVKRDNYNVPVPDLPMQYAKAPLVDIADSQKNVVAAPAALSPPAVPAAPVPPATASPLSAVLPEWWRLLGSRELNSLMDRALANNPDLRIAALRIAQSKARLDQAGAGKAPTITMPVQVRNEYPDTGIGRGSASGKNKSRITHQISLKGDWRPDIWGESYSLYESAELQLLRATYQRDDMQRNVAANVALSYMEYLSLNDRLRVARETEKSLSEMLASVEARLEVGDATITEMEQQKAGLYAVIATFPVLEQQREIVLNRLAALVGSVPVALQLSEGGLNSVKFPSVLPGAPSALLLRRPDVRAVEAQLLAADADIDVARARVLPPLDLTAQAGYGSMHLSKLFASQAIFWSAIANLSVTIFDSGKRSKEVEFAKAMHEELLETYIRVIYDAVREVDDSLSAINQMGKRLDAQGVASDSALHAWNFSQEAFMAGAVDYLVVLDTQRTYQRNLDDWYNVRMERYRSLINLFSALGGGVPGGDAMPGEGARPAPLADEGDDGMVLAEAGSPPETGKDAVKKLPGETFAANQPGRTKSGSIASGVDWAGNSLRSDHWLVELSGIYDRGAVLPAWRDLRVRFYKKIEKQTLLPQRQGQVDVAGKERASWYRLFIASFPEKNAAEEFCAMLRAGHQRCGVVSAQSLGGKDGFVAPPASVAQNSAGASQAVASAQQGTRVTGTEVGTAPMNTAPVSTEQDARMQTQKQVEAGTSAKAEAVRAKAEREARAAAEADVARLKAELDALVAEKNGLAAQTGISATMTGQTMPAQLQAKAEAVRAEAEREAWAALQVERVLLKAEQQALLDEAGKTVPSTAAKAISVKMEQAVRAPAQAQARKTANAEAVRAEARRVARAEAEAELARLKAEQKALLAEEARLATGAKDANTHASEENTVGRHKK